MWRSREEEKVAKEEENIKRFLSLKVKLYLARGTFYDTGTVIILVIISWLKLINLSKNILKMLKLHYT